MSSLVLPALFAATAAAGPSLAAQEVAPPGLADAEVARTRACVPALARLSSVNADLLPLARRADRIRALAGAVTLEDTTAVVPLDGANPLEQAVRDWFAADAALAGQYVTSGDEAIQARRKEARDALLERLAEARRALSSQGQERLDAEEDLSSDAARCEDAILVRTVALETCATLESPVCQQAREAAGAPGPFRFVEAPADLWDVESIRPWSSPSRLAPGPGGGLGGARTEALARRGNVTLVVQVEPLIRPRTAVGEEAAAAMDASLDSLGFTFEHPDLVMAPALAFTLDVPAILGGETHYLLHFGDLSDPAQQVVWSGPASGAPFQMVVPASASTLRRLAAGETLSLTAARIPEGEGAEGEAVFTLTLPSAGQAQAVSGLVTYMAGGQLSRDLAALVPPASQPGR